MRGRILVCLLILVLVAACGGPPKDKTGYPGVVTGRAVDSETSEPIEWVAVTIMGLSLGDVTDDSGRFYVSNVPPGRWNVIFSSWSHQDDTVAVDIGRTPDDVIDLAEVVLEYRWDLTNPHYREGWERAAADLEVGRAAHFRTGGLPADDYPQRIDTALGLPVVGNFSCLVDKQTIDLARGYNDCIEKYVRTNGLPSNSRKKWNDLILHPKKFFKAMAKTNPPFDLRALQDTVQTQEDGYRVVFVPARRTLIIISPSATKEMFLLYEDPNSVKIVRGPEGSCLVVVKTDYDYSDQGGWAVIDLAFGYYIGW